MSKQQTLEIPKPRNPAAKALASRQFAQKVVPNKKVYDRNRDKKVFQ